MTWPTAARGSIAQTLTRAARWLRSDTAHQPECRIVAEDGPAEITGQKPRHGTVGHTDLTARAVRICNRNPEAVDRYLAKHQALASRIYSGRGDE